MPPTAGPVPISDQIPMGSPIPVPETVAKDAIIAWFRGEFAAANAIIDALCNHLTQINGLRGCGSEYESVFAAIHRRRLNWIPILNMQKYCSIADVALELRRVASEKVKKSEEEEKKKKKKSEEIRVSLKEEEESMEGSDGIEINREPFVEELRNRDDADEKMVEEDLLKDDSSDRKVTEGSEFHEGELPSDNLQICSIHEDYEARRAQIKTIKGFVAKEPVKGNMVNVVKGLKLYEDIFTDSELSKLTGFVNELRIAGRNGELSGDTFTLFNQQLKGNKRELIQLGFPIFGHIKEEETSNIEPIPSILQAVINHLVQWHLIPESRKPNSCIINFFDEGEYSQPYLKPPHLDQPISALLLSETSMAFGRVLMTDNHGNYKGPLMLSLKEGSLLVMRGNSADMARHVICPSSNKRISITFFKVRNDTDPIQPLSTSPFTRAMKLWQPNGSPPHIMPNGAINGYEPIDMLPKWGVLRSPLVMLAPVGPIFTNPQRGKQGGTGVFLPWTVGSKKHVKHLPPRAQRERLLSLPSPVETQVAEPTSA